VSAYRFLVNGAPAQVDVPGMRRLLDVLREDLGLTGTKEGCGEGECGACSVLLDGQVVDACLVPVCQVEGRIVRTVEGLSLAARERGALDALQEAFLEHGAAQCGICTPGMLMAAVDCLSRTQAPTRAEVEDALGGVLCRCTGYIKIVEAVLEVAGGVRPCGSDPRAQQRSEHGVRPAGSDPFVGARLARGQERLASHQHARRADAALGAARLQEGGLQDVQRLPVGQPLDGVHRGALDLADRDQAGVDQGTVDQHRAGAALALPAALLGAGQRQVFAEDVKQATHAGRIDLHRGAIDVEPIGHGMKSCGGSVGPRSGISSPPAGRSSMDGVLGAGSSIEIPGGGGIGPSVMAARIRSGVAGRSWIHTPVASWIAATTAGAPTSIGSSPTPLARCGASGKGASTRIEVIRGASSAVGMRYVASRSLT